MKRQIRKFSKHLLHSLFVLGQRIGVDVLPRHFYSEIPDVRLLSKQTAWRLPFTMQGISGVAFEDQLRALRAIVSAIVTEELLERDIHAEACRMNGEPGFGAIEAECLYAFIRTRKPAQIYQIGCGVSTAVCLLAAERARYSPDIICVEPYPTRFLETRADSGCLRLLRLPAQAIDIATINELQSNLLFFVDSSHTLGPAGEVTRIILDLLPRLKQGASVHFHDIRFPYDYERRVLTEELFFQHESPLLQAFLCYNTRFEIEICMSMLHYGASDALKDLFPRYRPAPSQDGLETGPGHFPSSTYLTVVG
jgi:hypothetical protein